VSKIRINELAPTHQRSGSGPRRHREDRSVVRRREGHQPAHHLRPGARVEATRVGVRPMLRDQRPMVGGIPGLEGFYVVTAHSGWRSVPSGAGWPPPSCSTACPTPGSSRTVRRGFS